MGFGPAAEVAKEQFESRDQHVRKILQQLKNVDPGRLATLADALAQGETFWQNLSVSPAAKPAEAPEAAPLGTQAPMPTQTPAQTPAQTQFQPPSPAAKPKPGTQEAWEQHLQRLDRQKRLKETRPPGMTQ
jgi:hypothetical protein